MMELLCMDVYSYDYDHDGFDVSNTERTAYIGAGNDASQTQIHRRKLYSDVNLFFNIEFSSTYSAAPD